MELQSHQDAHSLKWLHPPPPPYLFGGGGGGGNMLYDLYQLSRKGREPTGLPAKEPTREMACQLQVNMVVVKEAEKRLVLSRTITCPL